MKIKNKTGKEFPFGTKKLKKRKTLEYSKVIDGTQQIRRDQLGDIFYYVNRGEIFFVGKDQNETTLLLSELLNDPIHFAVKYLSPINPLTIDSNIDENHDSVIDERELRKAVLDIDEDNDTDGNDAVLIITNHAIN